MKFIIQRIDVFDRNIDTAFDEIVTANNYKFNIEKPYHLVVSFKVNLINDPRIEEFISPKSNKGYKNSNKDPVNEFMDAQLSKFENVMITIKNQIDVFLITIQ